MLKHPGVKAVPCPNCGTGLVAVRRRGRVSTRVLALAVGAMVIAAADTPGAPIGIPSIDQLVNASPAVLLAIGFIAFLRGTIVQGYLYIKSEKRADDATTAAVLSNATTANAVKAVADLSAAHTKEVADLTIAHKQEIEMLRAELARLQPARRGGG